MLFDSLAFEQVQEALAEVIPSNFPEEGRGSSEPGGTGGHVRTFASVRRVIIVPNEGLTLHGNPIHVHYQRDNVATDDSHGSVGVWRGGGVGEHNGRGARLQLTPYMARILSTGESA